MKKLSSVLVVSLALLSPFAYTPAYPQAARVFSQSIDDLIRFAQRNAGKIRFVHRTYRIIKTIRKEAGIDEVLITYAGSPLIIYFDCQNRRVSNSLYYLPQEQQVNLVRDACPNLL